MSSSDSSANVFGSTNVSLSIPINLEFNTHAERSQRVRDDVACYFKWMFRFACAIPDYKRPSVKRGFRLCKTEKQAYMEAMKQLDGYGVLGSEQGGEYKYLTDKKLGLSKEQAIHWNSWRKGNKTLENAKALYDMANDGAFCEYRYSNYCIGEPAFDFHITPESGVFIAIPEHDVTDIRVSLHDDLDKTLATLESVPKFVWKWMNMEPTKNKESKKRSRYDLDVSDDESSDSDQLKDNSDESGEDTKMTKE